MLFLFLLRFLFFCLGSIITLVVFIAIGHIWQKHRANRIHNIPTDRFHDVPPYFFLLLSLFWAWYPLLNLYRISFSTLYPQWLWFLLSLPASLISLAVASIFLPSFFVYRYYRRWVKPKFPKWTLHVLIWKMTKFLRERPHIQKTLWILMCFLCFIGIGGFFLNDYERTAQSFFQSKSVNTCKKQYIVKNDTSMGCKYSSNNISKCVNKCHCKTTKCGCHFKTVEPNLIGEFTVQFVFPVLGGIGAIIGFIVSWITSSRIKAQGEKENTVKNILAKRFDDAIQNLGSDKQVIVLGSVHTLYDLALNYKEYRRSVFEILCSFIREETNKPEYQAQVLKKQKEEENADASAISSSPLEQFYQSLEHTASGVQCTSLIVIQTIIDKLFREKESQKIYDEVFKENRADLIGAFLPNINLREAHMPKVILRKANLQKADLREANLQGAYLYKANLQKADLREAKLQGASLWDTNLQGANLYEANLQGANLYEANLQKADFKNADLRGIQSFTITTSQEAYRNKTGLPTDLSGITLYDDNGKALDLTEDEKKEWFRKKGAIIGDDPMPGLTADDVQQFGKKLGW